MARRKISQTDAWQLFHENKRLRKLINDQRQSWSEEWPDGTWICSDSVSVVNMAAIRTARLLGHAVVAVPYNDRIEFAALPIPSRDDL